MQVFGAMLLLIVLRKRRYPCTLCVHAFTVIKSYNLLLAIFAQNVCSPSYYNYNVRRPHTSHTPTFPIKHVLNHAYYLSTPCITWWWIGVVIIVACLGGMKSFFVMAANEASKAWKLIISYPSVSLCQICYLQNHIISFGISIGI